jgi:hypothetical protein
MKFTATTVTVLLSCAAIAGAVLAQPRPAAPAGAQPDELQKHLDEAKKASAPGPKHASLMSRAGSYTVKTQFWMDAAKTGQPMESTGEATLKAALDGRFLAHEETGSILNSPVSSFKYWGYNTAAGKHEAMWSYTGSTAMMQMSGTASDDGKTVTYSAGYSGSSEKFDVVWREGTADTFTIELIGVNPDGSKGPTMVSTYTRKK